MTVSGSGERRHRSIGPRQNFTPRVLKPGDRLHTTAIYPVFLMYLPDTPARWGQFILQAPDQTSQPLYRTRVPLPAQAGVLRIELPTDGAIAPLVPQQVYPWSFSLLESEGADSPLATVTESVERVPLSPDLESEMHQQSEGDRPAFFQSIHQVYDALVALDALRRCQPNDGAIAQAWATAMMEHHWAGLVDAPPLILT